VAAAAAKSRLSVKDCVNNADFRYSMIQWTEKPFNGKERYGALLKEVSTITRAGAMRKAAVIVVISLNPNG
jgi:hypothetical protein